MLCVGICCNSCRKEAVEITDNSSCKGTYVRHKYLFILSKIIVVQMRLLSNKKINQLFNDVKVMHHLPRASDLIRKHPIDFPTDKLNFSSSKRCGIIKFLKIYFM